MRIHAEPMLHSAAQRTPPENRILAGDGADADALVPRRLPAFLNLQEALLENIIQNILVEASRGEVVLTSRPRVIALPPLSFPRWGHPAGGCRDRTRGVLRVPGEGVLGRKLRPHPCLGFLSSRTPTPDLLPPPAPLESQQIVVPRLVVAPPSTEFLRAPAPSPLNLLP